MGKRIVKNRVYFIILVYFLLMILPFQKYLSIEINDFKVRFLHITLMVVFLMTSLVYISKNYVLYNSKNYFFSIIMLIVVLFLNPYNYINLYTYYFIFILLGSYSLYFLIVKINISYKKLLRNFPYIWLVPIFCSLFTMKRNWHGGFQMMSISDFPIYFSMQISAIIPFIFLSKYKFFLLPIYTITLLLLGSRGPILVLSIVSFFFIKGVKNKISLISFMSSIVMFAYLYNPELINFYVSKLLVFNEEVYHDSSDMNRFLYIIATLNYPSSIEEIMFGHGVKYNKYIISDFFLNFYGDKSFGINDNSTVHNLYLEIFSDLGVVGMVFVMKFLYSLLRDYFALYRRSHDKYIKIAFSSYLIFLLNYMLEPNYVHFYFWIMLSIYTYIIDQYKKEIGNETKIVFC